MQLKTFEELARPDGILPPQLGMLNPDIDFYSVLAFQPAGRLSVTDQFIGNADQALARAQFSAAVDLALAQNADLLVTPEYSCPWEVLLSSVEAGKVPPEGRLWVLGCESARPADLQAYSTRLNNAGFKIYAEALAPNGGHFVDPVCYVFQTRDSTNTLRKVALIQFKTAPSGDGGHFYEQNNLIRGETIYTLTRPTQPSIRLSTLICSDVLALPQAERQAIAADGLILHLQLNPKPRDPVYALYRSALYTSAQRVEVFCLNWAEHVESVGQIQESWENESFSAFYWRSSRSDLIEDARFDENHPHGLHRHHWKKYRVDVCVLNFKPGIFHFRTTKTDQQLGAPQQQGKLGPQALGCYQWDGALNAWQLRREAADSGLAQQLARGQGDDYSCLNTLSPLSIERFITLSAGRARKPEWFRIRDLPLAELDGEEVSWRVSFAQDPHERALAHRDLVLRALGALVKILTDEEFPLPIRDLHGKSSLSFDAATPWFNLFSSEDGPPATVVYLGHNPVPAELERIRNDIKDALGKESNGRRGDPNRLVLWYHDGNGRLQLSPIEAPRIDALQDEHSASIGKVD